MKQGRINYILLLQILQCHTMVMIQENSHQAVMRALDLKKVRLLKLEQTEATEQFSGG